MSFVMVDADHFKTVNDRFGHVVGDNVLVGLAEPAAGILRRTASYRPLRRRGILPGDHRAERGRGRTTPGADQICGLRRSDMVAIRRADHRQYRNGLARQSALHAGRSRQAGRRGALRGKIRGAKPGRELGDITQIRRRGSPTSLSLLVSRTLSRTLLELSRGRRRRTAAMLSDSVHSSPLTRR